MTDSMTDCLTQCLPASLSDRVSGVPTAHVRGRGAGTAGWPPDSQVHGLAGGEQEEDARGGGEQGAGRGPTR